MTEKRCRLSLKYRLMFYAGGFVFATASYTLGLWVYGIESASWGDVQFYQRLVSNMLGAFQSHSLSFFLWELVCMGIAITLGHFFDREVYYRRIAEQQANVDGLTGAYNHRYFQERLSAEVERAVRYGRLLSLIMLDLDDFKQFNDTWGHQEGDRLLKWFGGICAQCVRNIDVLARYGGEEFVVVLPETKAEEAFTVAERIRETVERQSPLAFGKNRGITISAGVANLPQHGNTRHTLTLCADAALYHAKQRGKNRCFIYEEECQRSYKPQSGHVAPLICDDDMGAIEALGATVDARDSHRQGHSMAVMQGAVLLGQKIGLSAEEIANLRVASLLHDIGNVALPSAVLEKEGPLDQDEWKSVENHAMLGSKVLKRVQQMVPIIPGVKHHHERYDGKGYPGGLSGKNIPLLARIIAIADAFDAMTNSRSYHKALTPAEAVEEVKRCAGTQFDPELAEAFVAAVQEELASGGEAEQAA